MYKQSFFIFGILICGRGGYNNAQPAKSYFEVFLFGSGTFWEWPVCEIQVSYYHYFYNTKTQNTKFGRGRGWILNFASYHYFFITKLQNSKFGRGSGRIPSFEFC